jgi:hypothetical protein
MSEKEENVLQAIPVKDVAKPAPDPLGWLNAAERHAYHYFLVNMRKGGMETYPLAPSTTDGMRAVFIKGGKTLEEIRRLNKPFGMGQIVHAAVEGNWYQARLDDAALTMARAEVRAKLAAAEGAEMAADVIASIRRLHGDSIARYLQTGDISELSESSPITVARQLKEAADALARFTGQDQVRKVSGTLKVEHVGLTIPTSPPTEPAAGHASVLAGWAAAEKVKLEKDLKD